MVALPISVVILTKNEEARLAETLECLKSFQDIWVVDSNSTDKTVDIAHRLGANVQNFDWNAQYPKKKQWALDNIPLKYEWVLLLDADERVTEVLLHEIEALSALGRLDRYDGFFIKGLYRIGGRLLRYGQCNKKLSLYKCSSFRFPDVGDENYPGGWEVEGHYQPLAQNAKPLIGTLKSFLFHDAYDDLMSLKKRHKGYAMWEAHMNMHDSWPADPVSHRDVLKRMFRALPCRRLVIFLYSYIFKLGFLDGRAGLLFAWQRYNYYKDVAALSKALKKGAVQSSVGDATD